MQPSCFGNDNRSELRSQDVAKESVHKTWRRKRRRLEAIGPHHLAGGRDVLQLNTQVFLKYRRSGKCGYRIKKNSLSRFKESKAEKLVPNSLGICLVPPSFLCPATVQCPSYIDRDCVSFRPISDHVLPLQKPGLRVLPSTTWLFALF